MTTEQLPLFSHNLPPLRPRDVVRTPDGWIGEVAQVWPGRDHYVVFAKSLPMSKPLPVFRRDEAGWVWLINQATLDELIAASKP